jgi:hypothetical protein
LLHDATPLRRMDRPINECILSSNNSQSFDLQMAIGHLFTDTGN